MIDNSQIFAWDNYDDNPQDAIGVDTTATQKDAVYCNTAEPVFNGNELESFFTNNDEGLYPQAAEVIGETPMELIEGKGYVTPSEGEGE